MNEGKTLIKLPFEYFALLLFVSSALLFFYFPSFAKCVTDDCCCLNEFLAFTLLFGNFNLHLTALLFFYFTLCLLNSASRTHTYTNTQTFIQLQVTQAMSGQKVLAEVKSGKRRKRGKET